MSLLLSAGGFGQFGDLWPTSPQLKQVIVEEVPFAEVDPPRRPPLGFEGFGTDWSEVLAPCDALWPRLLVDDDFDCNSLVALERCLAISSCRWATARTISRDVISRCSRMTSVRSAGFSAFRRV